jgi:hypothetical protein
VRRRAARRAAAPPEAADQEAADDEGAALQRSRTPALAGSTDTLSGLLLITSSLPLYGTLTSPYRPSVGDAPR